MKKNVSKSDLEEESSTGCAETDDMSTLNITKAIQSFKQDFHAEMELVVIKNAQSDIKEFIAEA